MGQGLHIISVGSPKATFWKEAGRHYRARLSHWRKIKDSVVRDSAPNLPVERKIAEEGHRILAAVTPKDIVVCLDENGKTMTSRDFSVFLERLSADANRQPCFVVGGPFGLSAEVLKTAKYSISFGPQTLPHELALVILLEQLYRAESMLRNFPYHHA